MARSPERIINLVRRIEGGDGKAEAELVESYARAVNLLLLKRTGNAQLAMDLSQETFCATIQKLRLGGLRNPQCLTAFIRQIAVNLCNDQVRKDRRFQGHEHDSIASLAARRDNKGQQLDSRLARNILEKALCKLSVERDQQILRRFYLQEEEKQKICSELDLSAHHFDRVLYRAKQRIRSVILADQRNRSILAGQLTDG